MADQETAPVSNDDDIQDVSLVDTPMNAPLTPSGQSEADTTAATEDTEQQGEQTKDANATEAKTEESGDKTEQSTETEQQEQQPASKEERDAIAQQAWRERQRTRQQIAQQIDTEYGPQSAEDLIAEGVDPAQAAIEALRQEFTFNNERTRVAELNAGMRAEAVEIMHDFPVFDPQSPQFDEEFTREVEASYKQASRLQTNENGSLILNADVPLYDHYQRMWNIYNRGTSRGAQTGQEQMLTQMAATENPGGSSSVNGPTPGSLEDLEQRLADVPIT